MITYEIRIHDYVCGVTSVEIRSFMMAMRFYESINLTEYIVFRKELITHDWEKHLNIVIRDEEYV